MLDHAAILTELQCSLDEALARADDRLSHVQRQLAGSQQPLKAPVLPVEIAALQESNELIESVDADLARLHASLAELIQQGRASLHSAA
jgi:hypothetical protein